MPKLASMSDAELVAELQRIGNERAEAEAKFKAEAAAVKAELDGRAVAAQIAQLSPEVVAAIRASEG